MHNLNHRLSRIFDFSRGEPGDGVRATDLFCKVLDIRLALFINIILFAVQLLA